MQCDSVIESLDAEGDIPLDTISLSRVSEDTIGGLIYYYELLTSLVGELIDVNTYDQPGVEAGKIILKKKSLIPVLMQACSQRESLSLGYHHCPLII